MRASLQFSMVHTNAGVVGRPPILRAISLLRRAAARGLALGSRRRADHVPCREQQQVAVAAHGALGPAQEPRVRALDVEVVAARQVPDPLLGPEVLQADGALRPRPRRRRVPEVVRRELVDLLLRQALAAACGRRDADARIHGQHRGAEEEEAQVGGGKEAAGRGVGVADAGLPGLHGQARGLEEGVGEAHRVQDQGGRRHAEHAPESLQEELHGEASR
mmetsp:Transcript_15184/g.43403  ORF Transcript_15184/g.43403 Transcript_15184/m.43403 type:complete len:219 (+) Transcript_15184:374-1030(+)